MKYLKCLICNFLCINNLYNSNLEINNFEKNYPNNFLSFKRIKKYYLENNIYYDIYKDSLDNINKNKINNNELIKYNYYNDLTAEHIFPQSFIKSYPKAKFDMHNIFLTNAKMNSYRSNYKFVDENDYLVNNNYINYINLKSKLVSYNNSINYRNNSLKLFIPIHTSRGLIARSIAYMKYTYDDLILDNVINKNVLLKWNTQYPPTEIEKKQNLLIENIQGNKNIFITQYKLVDQLF